MNDKGEDEIARAKTIGNERTKLTATYLNGIAIATFAASSFTFPINGVTQGQDARLTLVLLPLVGMLISLTSHFTARLLLRSLR